MEKSTRFLTIIFLFTIFFIGPRESGLLKGISSDYSLVNTNRISCNNLLPEIEFISYYDGWFNSKIEMIIIIPDEQFLLSSQTLKSWKNDFGIKTTIINNILNYSGRDKASKIRSLIKSYYLNEKIKWVLLVGDASEDLIPTRYVYNPDTILYHSSEYGGYSEYYKPTDFYYTDLTGNWDEDNDGRWGESSKYNSNGIDEIDWIPEVYVGRFLASTPEELEIMVNKTIQYEKNPPIGNWMNQMLLAGGISSYSPAEDETRLTTHIINNYLQSGVNFTHLCEYTSSYTPPDPKEVLTQTSFTTHFNDGYSTVFYAGHGDPYRLIRNPNGANAYTYLNANSSSNINKPSLIYSFACTTSPYDQNDDNIGEILLKQKEAGAVGYIGGMRITWYFENDQNLEKLNRGNAKLFWKEFYENKKFQQGKALYDSKVSYMNSPYFDDPSVSMDLEYERKNVLTYNLLGDPSLDIYTDIPQPVVNPFAEDIYEGQFVNVTIKDVEENIISNARVHFSTSDGIYRTFYADSEGMCNFTIPVLGNKTYNVTITGHNLIPSYFTLTTLKDEIPPILYDLHLNTTRINASESIHFEVKADDYTSGMESVHLIISKNNFSDYEVVRMEDMGGDSKTYQCDIYNLETGIYSYMAIARDYANNTETLSREDFIFEVLENHDHNNQFPSTLVLKLMMLGLCGIIIILQYRRITKKRAFTTIEV